MSYFSKSRIVKRWIHTYINNYIILIVFKFSSYPIASPRNLTHRETFAKEFSDIALHPREKEQISRLSPPLFTLFYIFTQLNGIICEADRAKRYRKERGVKLKRKRDKQGRAKSDNNGENKNNHRGRDEGYKTGTESRISVTGPSANERIRHRDLSPRVPLSALFILFAGARVHAADSVKVSRTVEGVRDKNVECVATRSPKRSFQWHNVYMYMRRGNTFHAKRLKIRPRITRLLTSKRHLPSMSLYSLVIVSRRGWNFYRHFAHSKFYR